MGENYHLMIAAPSGEPKSLLSQLTDEERRRLVEWSDTQIPTEAGVVDLMKWPGWAKVAECRMGKPTSIYLDEGRLFFAEKE